MKFVNMTPHTIKILIDTTRPKILEPSGIVPRAEEHREQIGNIDGVPINHVSYGDPVGLPPEQHGIGYIVSAITAKAAKAASPYRQDLFIPDESVRDESGRIIGCKALAKV